MKDDLAENGSEWYLTKGVATDAVQSGAFHLAGSLFELNAADLLNQPPITGLLKHDHIPDPQSADLTNFLDEDIITVLVSRA